MENRVMKHETKDGKDRLQQSEPSSGERQDKPRSSAFRESGRGDKKSTTNVEEEAGQEQERKEAMTERD